MNPGTSESARGLPPSRTLRDLGEKLSQPASHLGYSLAAAALRGAGCLWRFAVLLGMVLPASAASADALFREGVEAYRAADYAVAARAFADAAALQPAAGTLQNLGNAQWKAGRVGPAILAWEQALCLAPFNAAVRGNLRFARKTAQLESPQLTWYEVVATWLPFNQWAWLANLSFWLAVAMVLLPGVLRLNRASWHQAVAALGLAVFLLSLPALFGVATRSRLGFVLEQDTPLRLTATAEAQVITRLSAGDPARWRRTRGNYVLVSTGHATGWLECGQLGLICQPYAPKALKR